MGPLPSWAAVVQVLAHRFQKLTMYFLLKVTQLNCSWVYFITGLVASPLYCLLHLVMQTCQLVFILVVPEFDSGLVLQRALEVQSLFSVHRWL